MTAISRLDFWVASLLAVFAGLIFYPFAFIGVDPHHDGIMLKPALDVLSGQVLFRDTFSQYGPLTTYLQAAVLELYPALLGLRLLTAAAYAGSLFFLYLAWRNVLPRSLGLVGCLLFMIYVPFFAPDWLMLPWSSALALFFQSIAIWALLCIVGGRTHPVWAWTLGIACACTLWCRQPVGIIMTGSAGVIAIALYVTGWRSSAGPAWRIVARVAIGFGVISALILGHLAFNDALGAWLDQSILWPMRWAKSMESDMYDIHGAVYLPWGYAIALLGVVLTGLAPSVVRRLGCVLPRWVDLVWLGVLVGAYFGFAHPWIRRILLVPTGGWTPLILALISVQALVVLVPIARGRFHNSGEGYHLIAALTALVIGSCVQVYPVPCAGHIFWAISPCLGVFIYLFWKWSRLDAWSCSLTLVLLLIPAGFEKYQLARLKLLQPSVTLQSPALLKGMQVDPQQALALQRVDAVMQKLLAANPDQSVLLYGDNALYLTWFKNGENPSPYYIRWVDMLNRSERLKRAAFIERKQPVLLFQNNIKEVELGKFMNIMNYRIIFKEPSLQLWIALPDSVYFP